MLECNSEVLSGMVPANQSVDVRTKDSIEFQFAAGTVSVTRSLDGITFSAWPVYQSDGTLVSIAATPGIYSTDGSGYLKFSADVSVRAVRS